MSSYAGRQVLLHRLDNHIAEQMEEYLLPAGCLKCLDVDRFCLLKAGFGALHEIFLLLDLFVDFGLVSPFGIRFVRNNGIHQ